MKNIVFLLFCLFCVLSFSTKGQKIINNPEYSAKTAANFKITKISLLDTATVIDFETKYFPKWWIRISSDKAYIQNSKGGEKLFVTQAEGIELDKKHTTPESGINIYKLFFPPIDKSVETLDYIGGSYNIYDLELVPQKHVSTIPKEIQGNWLRTDGSNEWVYGIYDNLVIYNNKFWDSVRVKSKGKKYELILQREGEQEHIYVKIKKDDLLAGNDPNQLQLFSKRPIHNPNYVIPNNEEFQLPIFKEGTSIYKGYIAGYHPKMGTTGMAYVNNVLKGEQHSQLIKINSNGTFSAKIPMLYPQVVIIKLPEVYESFFFQPGDTLFHYLDIAEYTTPYKNSFQRKKRARRSLFMGGSARINADLQALDSISYFNYDLVRKKIIDMSADDYKKYCLNALNKEQRVLSHFLKENNVSKKAIQLKRLDMSLNAYQYIFSYNLTKESAYRKKHKIPREQRKIPLQSEKLAPEYFDFIEPAYLTTPVALTTGGTYYFLINRIKFADVVREQPNHNQLYINLQKRIEEENVVITNDQKALLDKFINCADRDCIKEHFKSDSITWASFYKAHKDLFFSVAKTMMTDLRNQRLKEFFGLSDDLASDIMLVQDQVNIMKGQSRALTNMELQIAQNNISNDFVSDYLATVNKAKAAEIERIIEENKTKTGYVMNETPDTEADKLFSAIIEKYKGKVVFVDFWATWCGPCRSGMERMKPLKEELKDRNIEFVYITNHTSPIDTWNMLIPDVKGQHYRVNEDEWNILSSKFDITGIPHYVLVDKNSNVVQNKIYFNSSNDELRDLLELYLD